LKISELQPRQSKIEIECEVLEKGEIKEFDKFGKTLRLCNAKVKDDSGEVTLTLWNDEIDMVKEGDKIKITNGYCNEFQGEKQLTAGRFGKLEVVE